MQHPSRKKAHMKKKGLPAAAGTTMSYGDPDEALDNEVTERQVRTSPVANKSLQSLAKRAGSGIITDADGIRRSYEQGDAYSHGKTLYVAGSHTARDWLDDVTRIPFWRPLFGGSKAIHRYQMAQQAAAETKPETVVGHSLGGAVALQMQKESPELKTRTYGAPVFDPLGQSAGERYRSRFDPVSILDRGATSTLDAPSLNVSGFHSYDATASRNTAEGDATMIPQENAVAITE